MNTKRALIVDDSRSARIILGRILDTYEMQVDTAESAEDALEYLRHTRPDVIFLDHLMPGMDGFQAIHAIKSNPDTAMIPVMMYTSQEGELYVSQARALGAVGVLPKTVKPMDVSRLLSQLRLLPDSEPIAAAAPARLQSANQHEAMPAARVELPSLTRADLETALRVITDEALELHNVELRRFIASSLEAFARRINAEAQTPLAGSHTAAPNIAAPTAPILSEYREPAAPRKPGWLAAMLAVALIPTAVLGVIYARQVDSAQQLAAASSRLEHALEQQQVQLGSVQEQLREAALARAAANAREQDSLSEVVPYGEPPLGGTRLERLKELIADLAAQGFKGKVKVAAYVGDFCLAGNGSEGFAIAGEELPWRRCDVIGNPYIDSLPVAQRQTLEFANLLASLGRRGPQDISIEVVYRGSRPSVPYPQGERLSKVTAGEWNRIAAQNNRVEFTVQPQAAARALAGDLPSQKMRPRS